MAKEIVIKTRIDDTQSAAAIEKIKRDLTSIRGISVGDVETKFKALNAALETNTLSLRQMQLAMKEYTTIALHAGETSPIGKEAMRRAAELKDRINDANNAVNRLANDGFKMQVALQLSNTVINSYQALTGISALLGGEQERLIQIMAKMQIVQQTVAALEQVRAAFEKESFIVLQAKNAAMKVATVVQNAYSAAVASSSTTLGKFRLALISTGIGAFIVAIGMLISNFDNVSKFISRASSSLMNFARNIPVIGNVVKNIANIFNSVKEKVTELVTGLSAEERRMIQLADNIIAVERKKRESIDGEYKYQIEIMKARNADSYSLEKERLMKIEESINKEIKLYKEKQKISGELKEEEANLLKDLEKERVSIMRQRELLEVQHTQKLREEREKRLEEERKKIEEEKEANARKMEEMKRKEEEHRNAIEQLNDRWDELHINKISDKYARELAILDNKHRKEREQILQQSLAKEQLDEQLFLLDNIHKEERDQLIRQLDEAKRNEEIELQMKKYNEDLSMLEGNEIAKFELQRRMNEFRFANNLITHQQYLAEKKKIDDAEIAFTQQAVLAQIQLRSQLIQSLGGALNALSGLAREGSRINRAAALAGIIADTASGMMNGLILAQQAARTAPDPVSKGIIFATFYANQIAAVLSAANRAKQILGKGVNIPTPQMPQMRTPNIGGSSGSGSGSGSGVGVGVGTGGVTSTTLTNVGYDTVRVVVVESDITNVQNKNKKIAIASQL